MNYIITYHAQIGIQTTSYVAISGTIWHRYVPVGCWVPKENAIMNSYILQTKLTKSIAIKAIMPNIIK